jgi:hypothetical protein
MTITALIVKILISIGDGFKINQGWVDSMVIDIIAFWVLINSTAKHKWFLTVCGVIMFCLVSVITVSLSYTGIVVLPFAKRI